MMKVFDELAIACSLKHQRLQGVSPSTVLSHALLRPGPEPLLVSLGPTLTVKHDGMTGQVAIIRWLVRLDGFYGVEILKLPHNVIGTSADCALRAR